MRYVRKKKSTKKERKKGTKKKESKKKLKEKSEPFSKRVNKIKMIINNKRKA